MPNMFVEIQRMGKCKQDDEIPLQPQISLEPFGKWGLNLVGPIYSTSNQKNYILVCRVPYQMNGVEGTPKC